MAEADWQGVAKGLLKAELALKSISYEELSRKLAEIGIEEKPENINNKINRGTFSFVFFLQCMKAIGVNQINLR